jgi:hypothetical protein
VFDIQIDMVLGANKKIASSFKATMDGLKDFITAYGGALKDLAAQGQAAANDASDFWTNVFNKQWANTQAANAAAIKETIDTAQKLASGIPGAISSALYDAIKSGNFDDARQALRKALFESIIKQIIDISVAAVLTTGLIADKLVALSKVIKEAVATGDWTGVKDAIRDTVQSGIDAFNKLAPAIAGGVSGLIPDDGNVVTGARPGAAVSVNVPTITGIVAAPPWASSMVTAGENQLRAGDMQVQAANVQYQAANMQLESAHIIANALQSSDSRSFQRGTYNSL